MTYCKFIDENNVEIYRKKYVIVDGSQISHPSKETLLRVDIKPLVVEDIPAHDEATQYAEPYYIDGETEVTQKWTIKDIPEGVIDDELADA